jgi:HAMP domain-containing protein
MRGVRRLRGVWRGASFSLKFAAVILIAGATIAVVPLTLAEASARTQAENSAAERVSIAANLINGQRASLAAFIGGVGRQFAAGHDLTSSPDVQAALIEDGSVIGTNDILGLIESGGTVVAVQGATVIDGSLPPAVLSAASAVSATAASASGAAWLVAGAPVAGTTATVFVARPLTNAFVTAIDQNIATAADPVGVILTRGQHSIAVGGHATSLSPTLAATIEESSSQIVSISTHQFAVASTSIGPGLTLSVMAPFSGPPLAWQSILFLLTVILAAMLVIVVVVQTDLRRPLQRLDSAVAALGSGDFDRPVDTDTNDEVGRLGASLTSAPNCTVRWTSRWR